MFCFQNCKYMKCILWNAYDEGEGGGVFLGIFSVNLILIFELIKFENNFQGGRVLTPCPPPSPQETKFKFIESRPPLPKTTCKLSHRPLLENNSRSALRLRLHMYVFLRMLLFLKTIPTPSLPDKKKSQHFYQQLYWGNHIIWK